MLRSVCACAAGRFAVYPVRTIDEGIGVLTGREAGSVAMTAVIRRTV
jgi:hypothetical protein